MAPDKVKLRQREMKGKLGDLVECSLGEHGRNRVDQLTKNNSNVKWNKRCEANVELAFNKSMIKIYDIPLTIKVRNVEDEVI